MTNRTETHSKPTLTPKNPFNLGLTFWNKPKTWKFTHSTNQVWSHLDVGGGALLDWWHHLDSVQVNLSSRLSSLSSLLRFIQSL